MNSKQKIILLLDLIILSLAGICIRLTYISIKNTAWRTIIVVFILLLSILLITREIYAIYRGSEQKIKTDIPFVVALVGDNGQLVRAWDLNQSVGVLIGKSGDLVDADIDLTDSEFASYIDGEHAVLNYTGTGWWIEDLGSANGTSVRRNGRDILLASGTPNRLLPDDIIILGDQTKLAVR